MFFELDINQIKHNTKNFWSLNTVFSIKWLVRKKEEVYDKAELDIQSTMFKFAPGLWDKPIYTSRQHKGVNN